MSAYILVQTYLSTISIHSQRALKLQHSIQCDVNVYGSSNFWGKFCHKCPVKRLKCQLHAFCMDIKWRIRSVCQEVYICLSATRCLDCFASPHGSLWCKCVSIVIAAPFAQHLRLPTRSAVSLFSQNRITEIRTNNWVTLKCSRMRIPNSSESAEWVVCLSVSQSPVGQALNQSGHNGYQLDRQKEGERDWESGKGGSR